MCKVVTIATTNTAAAGQGYCYHSAAFRPSSLSSIPRSFYLAQLFIWPRDSTDGTSRRSCEAPSIYGLTARKDQTPTSTRRHDHLAVGTP